MIIKDKYENNDFLQIKETEITENTTRVKMAIKKLFGEYDLNGIEEAASLMFCSKNEVMHLAEGNYDLDIDRLITLAQHASVSVDYLLGITDVEKRYPSNKE